MTPKLTKTVALIGAAVATIGVASNSTAWANSGEVQADVQIRNFALYNNATGLILNAAPGGDFSAFLALDDASVSATLNGANAPQNLSVVAAPPSPPLDLAQAHIGSPYGQNDFTQHTAPPAGYFARSDQQLKGVIVAGIPAVPGPGNEPTPASSNLVSEVGLNGAGSGTAHTTSGTAGTVIFTPANNGIQVKILFDANSWLYAQLTPALQGRASQSLSFDLIDTTTGTEVFTWTPDGGAGGIVGGTQISDALSLNNGVGADAISNGPNCRPLSCVSAGFLTYEAITNPLLAGHKYQLTFSQTTTANLTVIPEPDSLALLGAVFAALGIVGGVWKRRVS